MVDLEESESDQEDAPSTGSFQSVSHQSVSVPGSSQSLSHQSVSVSGSSQSVSDQSVSVSGSSQSVQGATSGSSQSVPASETGVLQDSLREEEDEISQPLVVNTVPVQDLSTNTEYLEREETAMIERFLSNGCGCDLASGSNCSTLFTAESLESYRRDCSELTRAELDMTLLGQLVAFTNCSTLTAHSSRDWHPSVSRQRSYSLFWHGGRRVCKKTFLFLHTISDKRLRNLQRTMRDNGLAPRRHGNLRRLPSNAISYIDTQRVVEFLRSYSEANAILLPGRIPGYKRTDIQLLPSSTTKRLVWQRYCAATANSTNQQVAYSTFCGIWRRVVPHIMVTKPMSDLCWVCQANSTAITRSANLSEEHKSAVSTFT